MQWNFVPIFLFVLCMVGLGLALLVISEVANPGRSGNVKRMPYESGMDPIHDTRRRFDVRFHLVAIAFLVFDVELLFLYPWAVASRPALAPVAMAGVSSSTEDTLGQANGGISGPNHPLPAPSVGIDAAVAAGEVGSRDIVFGGVMTFLLLLTLGFVYDWRKGVFRWR